MRFDEHQLRLWISYTQLHWRCGSWCLLVNQCGQCCGFVARFIHFPVICDFPAPNTALQLNHSCCSMNFEGRENFILFCYNVLVCKWPWRIRQYANEFYDVIWQLELAFTSWELLLPKRFWKCLCLVPETFWEQIVRFSRKVEFVRKYNAQVWFRERSVMNTKEPCGKSQSMFPESSG